MTEWFREDLGSGVGGVGLRASSVKGLGLRV